MKKYLYEILKIILLVIAGFIAAAAIWGGIHLMVDPSGQGIALNQYLNSITFANNYLAIGIMLVSVIALSQILCIIMLVINNNYAGIFIAIAGTLLLIWSSVQLFYLGWFLYSALYFSLSIVEIGLAIWFYIIVKKQLKLKK